MTIKISISKALSLKGTIQRRLHEVEKLRNLCAVETERSYDGSVTNIKPLYDVKVLDTKVLKLERYLYDIDTLIKEANAKTKVDIDFDINEVLGPIA